MKLLNLLATVMGLAIAALGVLGITAPATLLEFGASLLTPTALYLVAGVRVLFGVLLLLVASASRLPKTLRAFGVVIVIAGLLTPLFGAERAAAAFNQLSIQGPMVLRAISVAALAFGLFVVYALSSPCRNTA
jgi:uncharacterized protein YjeT (DUF2065 family)